MSIVALIRCSGSGWLGICLGGRGGRGCGCSGGALEACAIDGQAFGGELGGIAVAHAFDALNEIVPVLEIALLALVHNLGGDARADALDAVEFGSGGLVDVYRSE